MCNGLRIVLQVKLSTLQVYLVDKTWTSDMPLCMVWRESSNMD